ncbi:hypothetical protein KAU51_00275 [Candidatus Parcubacteria bacterium]|nr:hypothetical protein [Candidatus Parcubacteria bacterium]
MAEKTIQSRLDGSLKKEEVNFRQDEVFIAYTIILYAEVGDTWRNILKRISEYFPLIRYKNENGIKNVLRKIERIGAIEMKETCNGSKITKISDECIEEFIKFHRNILEAQSFLEEYSLIIDKKVVCLA